MKRVRNIFSMVESRRRKRRLSRYADDKAVRDFERVARDKGLLPERPAADAAREDGKKDRAAYRDILRDMTGDEPPEF